MKRKDITALHDKTVDQLQTQLVELEQLLAKARLEKKAGKLADVVSPSKMSDDIARIKTILTRKQSQASTQTQDNQAESKSEDKPKKDTE